MGLGVFVPNGFEDAKFTDKAQASSFINNQTALVNALTKSKTTFFTPFTRPVKKLLIKSRVLAILLL